MYICIIVAFACRTVALSPLHFSLPLNTRTLTHNTQHTTDNTQSHTKIFSFNENPKPYNMQQTNSASNDRRFSPPPHDHRRPQRPPYRRPARPWPHQRFRPQFSPNYLCDRPPGPPPNFVIQLRCDHRTLARKTGIEKLIGELSFKPGKPLLFDKGPIAGILFYEQWNEALQTMAEVWGMRLNSGHQFTPWLDQNVSVDSDKDELRDRLKAAFMEKAKGLMEGELVQKWQKKLGAVLDEIKSIEDSLRKPNQIGVANELLKKKEGLVAERDLIAKRITEFKSGMWCIIEHLEEKGVDGSEEDGKEGEEFRVFKFGRDFDWERIYCLIMRECRRLDDGLPIYAYRHEILRQIHSQQIMVLIGETGSGKSTQLVQFLADSGVAANESIICTQPRKLASSSLAQRVREEANGCYQDSRITCYASYSSGEQLASKVIFMTDHCLLLHYMRDKNLSGVSCIIVDEAHERSLNTDLLLAVIKNLLRQRIDLRLVIMSATADADQLARYFFHCGTFHVAGRTFPVEIKYVPCESEGTSDSCLIAPYVSDAVRVVTEIHKTEKEGTILAFLTSQMEVEWACAKFEASSAIALPLHGKLSYDDQHRVFLNYPGKRKIIFATNVAETSVTIPGVKYVVDSGMMKESRFEPGSGMNLLRVCRISQSSANQRAGRAGRTEPGSCYRLYSENDFGSMPTHQEPEIRRVHLGVAVLRILALGFKDVQNFDFVDAPSVKAIEMAIRNLIQLGSVVLRDDAYELSAEGRDLVKLGIEPRLGKMILQCFSHRLGREGVVLAAVMANSSTVFCRIGTEQDKQKSDCLKVQFCHPSGDLFTLLAVYKAWEVVPRERRNIWCWDNSINAKSMRRCHETVQELEFCLQNELNIIIPSYWRWNPQKHTELDEILKGVMLSSLAENVAMYSGYDQLGYEVALTGKHIQLHPSCSLLMFNERPAWVVFGDILSLSNNYLVCATAVDYKYFSSLCPPLPFDFSKMDSQKLHRRTLMGFGTILLKRFCGRYNSNLHHLVSCIRSECADERIGIEVNVDENMIILYASLQDMDNVCSTVNGALEYERRLLHNECLEKSLYNAAATVTPSVALFGAGAQIKHLELEKRYLSVNIYHSDLTAFDDKMLLMFLERRTGESICGVHRFSGHDNEEKDKWGSVTFLSPNAAKKASELSQDEFSGGILKILPSQNICSGGQKLFSFPAVKAKVSWPRRSSKGIAIVKCKPTDVALMLNDFSILMIGGKYVRCKASNKYGDSIIITGLDIELSEAEIFEVLNTSTNRTILDFFLLRELAAVDNPSHVICEEALLRELSPFMPKRNNHVNSVRVQVFPPEPKDTYMRATITFDGSLHLEAAKALQQIDGKVLPGCFSWQKIRCQQMFHSTVSCPGAVYRVIKDQLDSLLARLGQQNGVDCHLVRNENGSYRVKISGNATKTVAELRRPLEEIMRGKIINHAGITPSVLQYLFSRDGKKLKESIQRETGTYILFDRRSLVVRIFGSSEKIDAAQQKLVNSILALHESKQLEVHLRGGGLPFDLMKRVVQKFGPDLRGLKEMVPAACFSLDTKRHCISINGANDVKQQVEDIIYEIVRTGDSPSLRSNDESICPICLCEVEDGYQLESCTHKFCRLCLVEQCDFAIRSREGFPLQCTQKGCGAPILVTDLRFFLSTEKLEDLFRASLVAYVAGSGGTYRFCPSPDCPSVYRVADPGTVGAPFACGACYVETCTRCHLEYHPYLSCEKYKEFKDDPDSSLHSWCMGRENVKKCPVCGFTIEKIEGCNHIECKCGRHICWVCLEFFPSSDDCYNHLRSVHLGIGVL